QPIFGGPAYAIRNVIVNVADEEFKLHARGTQQTVGAVMLHNTIVRGVRAVQVSSADVPLFFTVRDNRFIGPATIADGHTVRWDVPSVDTADIDHNGFYPDGMFEYGYDGTTYPTFADVVAAGGFDATSVLLDGAIAGTDDWTQEEPPTTPIP